MKMRQKEGKGGKEREGKEGKERRKKRKKMGRKGREKEGEMVRLLASSFFISPDFAILATARYATIMTITAIHTYWSTPTHMPTSKELSFFGDHNLTDSGIHRILSNFR